MSSPILAPASNVVSSSGHQLFRDAEKRYRKTNNVPPSLKYSPVVPEGPNARPFPFPDGQRTARTPRTRSKRLADGYTVMINGVKPDVYPSWLVL